MPVMNRLAAGLTALLLSLAACGGSTPSSSPSPTSSSAPTASPAAASPTPRSSASSTPASSNDIAAIFREIEDQVIAERGLEAKQRLEPIILSAAEARTRLEAQFRKENPGDKVAVAEETLKVLGLLPAGASLGDLYVDLMGSQVAGYYDTTAKELFVVSRSTAIGATDKATFAHEFTHALQDQHFDLQGIGAVPTPPRDRSLGRLALVEGDATLLMARWMSTHLSAAELGELLVVDPEAQAQLDRMPAILRERLLFPYQQGLIFVNGIWAGGGWAAVDAAYDRLPDSTEQILHPAKYEAREVPVEVALDGAALAKAMGAGWSGTPEDTLGEFQLSVWLRENGVTALPAGDAAAGWGGDRLAYLRGPNGAYALALLTAWDSQADADEFLAAAKTAASNLPGSAEARLVPASVGGSPDRVAVLVASDAPTLAKLSSVVGASAP
jgi:hypothetical protein